ncbi:MAG TPA: hypothetical protein VFS30_16615, partial [Dehalococcoidia bacterium]|nr:hypothetical protein [Dehalococcoidia bacterium]
LWVWRFYSKGGVTSGSIGLGTDGGPAADADIDRLTEAAIAEFDSEKRLEIIHDLQRVASGHAYAIAQPGRAAEFWLAQPSVRNFFVFQNDSRTVQQGLHSLYRMWHDETKA